MLPTFKVPFQASSINTVLQCTFQNLAHLHSWNEENKVKKILYSDSRQSYSQTIKNKHK